MNTKSNHTIFAPLYEWRVFILLALSCLIYYPCLDNFFVWDDFIWLHRGKTFWANPLQMFSSEGLYFDPLVYISFWFDYTIFGLDHRFYHVTDILLHSANGMLVFYFAKLITRNNMFAFLSGIIFISTFATSDTIIWPSSRVDLIATFFTLISITFFIRFLRENKTLLYVTSFIAYLLALGGKGTPVVLPALLLFLIYYERRGNWKTYKVLLPFISLATVYMVFLYAAGSDKNIFHGGNVLNFQNYVLSLSALFIPTKLLYKLNPAYTFFLICGLLFCFLRLSSRQNYARHISLFSLLLFLVPVLATGDFKVVSKTIDPYYLLSSASHRIYLASVGMSMFISSIIIQFYDVIEKRNKNIANIAILTLVAIFVVLAGHESRERINTWKIASDKAKNIIHELKEIKLTLPEDSIVGFMNFRTFPKGFFEPMIKVYYDLNVINIIEPPSFYEYLAYPFSPSDIERHFAFVAAKEKVYDFTDGVRELLATRLKYHRSGHSSERERLGQDFWNMAVSLNHRAASLVLDKPLNKPRLDLKVPLQILEMSTLIENSDSLL